VKRNNYIFLLNLFLLGFSLFAETQENNQTAVSWQKQALTSVEDLLNIQARIQEMIPKVQDSLVCIEAEDGSGSGVVVSADGLILSAAHVIGESGRTMKIIFPNGSEVDAISLGGSELSDAGMLQIVGKGPWDYVAMNPAHLSKTGDWCFALGHPNGFDLKRGLVLRAGRLITKEAETLQTDCRLLGGDSGGPLFSLDGKVIGIHSRISQDAEDNFHTPIESFLSNWEFFLHEQLHTLSAMQKGGFLGVRCEENDLGLLILEVVKGAPAEKSGLSSGDILTSLDDNVLDTREKLTLLVSSRHPGDEIVLNYLRDEQQASLRITLGARISDL
jgi:serine protease Do